MYGMTLDEGKSRLSKLLETLHQEPLSLNRGCSLSVTFRASVVQYPQHGESLQKLYQAAKALLGKTTKNKRIISAKELGG